MENLEGKLRDTANSLVGANGSEFMFTCEMNHLDDFDKVYDGEDELLIISPIHNPKHMLVIKEATPIPPSEHHNKLLFNVVVKCLYPGTFHPPEYNNSKYMVMGALHGKKSDHFAMGTIDFSDRGNQHTYRPLPTNLTIGESDIHGQGLILTGVKIDAGVTLGVSHIENNVPELDMPNNLIRTPLGGFINHSDTPNCIMEREGDLYYLVTSQEIVTGTEITVDYSECPCGGEV